MTKQELDALPLGLYQIFWRTGGKSLASIGMKENGERWLAPCNWVAPTLDPDVWQRVKSVELVLSIENAGCHD